MRLMTILEAVHTTSAEDAHRVSVKPFVSRDTELRGLEISRPLNRRKSGHYEAGGEMRSDKYSAVIIYL